MITLDLLQCIYRNYKVGISGFLGNWVDYWLGFMCKTFTVKFVAYGICKGSVENPVIGFKFDVIELH